MTRSYCQLAPEMDESNFQTLKLLWDRAWKLCCDQINWADYLQQYPTIFQDYIQHPSTTSMINNEKFLSIHNTNTSIWLKMAIFGSNCNIAINIVKLWSIYPGQPLTIKILWSDLRNYTLGSALDNIGCLRVISCTFVACRQN